MTAQPILATFTPGTVTVLSVKMLGPYSNGKMEPSFACRCSLHGSFHDRSPACGRCKMEIQDAARKAYEGALRALSEWFAPEKLRAMMAHPDFAYIRDGHSVSPDGIHVYIRKASSPTGVAHLGSVSRHAPGVLELLRAAGRVLPPVRYGEHR